VREQTGLNRSFAPATLFAAMIVIPARFSAWREQELMPLAVHVHRFPHACQANSVAGCNASVLVAPELRGDKVSSPARNLRVGEDSKPAPPRLRSYAAAALFLAPTAMAGEANRAKLDRVVCQHRKEECKTGDREPEIQNRPLRRC
jgi:hypothetical protein